MARCRRGQNRPIRSGKRRLFNARGGTRKIGSRFCDSNQRNCRAWTAEQKYKPVGTVYAGVRHKDGESKNI